MSCPCHRRGSHMSGSTGARAGAGTRTRARTRAPEVKRLYEPMDTGWLHGGGRAKGEGDGHMIPKAFLASWWSFRRTMLCVGCCVLCCAARCIRLDDGGLWGRWPIGCRYGTRSRVSVSRAQSCLATRVASRGLVVPLVPSRSLPPFTHLLPVSCSLVSQWWTIPFPLSLSLSSQVPLLPPSKFPSLLSCRLPLSSLH